jgi:hypothetical protein
MRTTTLLLYLLPFSLCAQHCGYDFASILVVRPHAEGDTTVIQGLRTTLLDSTNLPVSGYDERWYLFLRNTDLSVCGGYGHGSFNGQPCCFPFANDNYILVVGRRDRTEKMKVLVQDERDLDRVNERVDHWPVRFKQQIVPLTAVDAYSLCGRYDNAVYPTYFGEPVYHAVDIALTPR